MGTPINCVDYCRTGTRPFFSDEVDPWFRTAGTGEDLLEKSMDAPEQIALGGMYRFDGVFFGPAISGTVLRPGFFY
jgi:hypothetical protein